MPAPRLSSGLVALLLVAGLHGEVKVLKDFTLIDGTGGRPLAHAAMIIDNEYLNHAADVIESGCATTPAVRPPATPNYRWNFPIVYRPLVVRLAGVR